MYWQYVDLRVGKPGKCQKIEGAELGGCTIPQFRTALSKQKIPNFVLGLIHTRRFMFFDESTFS